MKFLSGTFFLLCLLLLGACRSSAAPAPTPTPPPLWAEYRDGLLRVSGGTLQHSASIQLGDSPGLDYTVALPKSAKNPQGIVDHARVYLVGGRVYGLDFVSRFSMAEAPEVNQFFDSFQVVPRDK